MNLSPRDAAFERLLSHLSLTGYDFVTPTPATHAMYLQRRGGEFARNLRDVLGWSMNFRTGEIDAEVEQLLYQAGALVGEAEALRSTIRVSTLDKSLFIHSAFPTTEGDAVFFGPDSYRFADLIRTELRALPGSPTIIDIGTGAGVGAVVAGKMVPGARMVMTDINQAAIEVAEVNARAAGVKVAAHCGDLFGDYDGPVDIALANPPYILDPAGRLYRDGGAMHGGELSVRMAKEVLPRLAPGGRFILYTGAAIVDCRDAMKEQLTAVATDNNCTLTYREIDPDVFGEELTSPGYEDVERIAAVAAVFLR